MHLSCLCLVRSPLIPAVQLRPACTACAAPAHRQQPRVQVLQLYAAQALSRSAGGGGAGSGGRTGDGESGAAEGVVQRLLAADEESWDSLLGEAASSEVRSKRATGFQLGLGEPTEALAAPAGHTVLHRGDHYVQHPDKHALG